MKSNYGKNAYDRKTIEELEEQFSDKTCCDPSQRPVLAPGHALIFLNKLLLAGIPVSGYQIWEFDGDVFSEKLDVFLWIGRRFSYVEFLAEMHEQITERGAGDPNLRFVIIIPAYKK